MDNVPLISPCPSFRVVAKSPDTPIKAERPMSVKVDLNMDKLEDEFQLIDNNNDKIVFQAKFAKIIQLSEEGKQEMPSIFKYLRTDAIEDFSVHTIYEIQKPQEKGKNIFVESLEVRDLNNDGDVDIRFKVVVKSGEAEKLESSSAIIELANQKVPDQPIAALEEKKGAPNKRPLDGEKGEQWKEWRESRFGGFPKYF